MKVWLARGALDTEFYSLMQDEEDLFPDDTFEVDPVIFNEYRNAVQKVKDLKRQLTDIALEQGVKHW